MADDLMDAVVQLSFTVTAALAPVAAAHDLSLTQLRVLGVLRDRQPRMAELADRLGLDRSTVSGLIDRAAQRGLVERVADPADRRSSRVRLTRQGRRLATTMTAEARRVLEPLLDAVPARDRERLARSLRGLLAEDGAEARE